MTKSLIVDVGGFLKAEEGLEFTGRLVQKMVIAKQNNGEKDSRLFLFDPAEDTECIRNEEEVIVKPGSLVAVTRTHILRVLDNYPNCVITIKWLQKEKIGHGRSTWKAEVTLVDGEHGGAWPPTLMWGNDEDDDIF